jgi:hypothetical protein
MERLWGNVCPAATICRLRYGVRFPAEASDGFFIIKPTRRNNSTNLFCHETLHVSGSSSVHHQEFIHCTLSNGICHASLKAAFEQDQDGTAVPSWSCSNAVSTVPVWHIPLLSVQWINSWWWTEELPETCRVSWQNKFVKLAHLVGFIIKKFVTMHCRSHDRKKKQLIVFLQDVTTGYANPTASLWLVSQYL